MYKHPINPKYIKQKITYHFKTYMIGTFIYNCTRGQLTHFCCLISVVFRGYRKIPAAWNRLNNKGGGELYEIKRSWDKTKQTKKYYDEE